MNIKITYKWLLEYLETDADPYEIQKYLSLRGPTVERVDKIQDDYVFDIEITSNRIDAASVIGIAQECSAILPRFGKKAKLLHSPLTQYRSVEQILKNISAKLSLTLKIADHQLAPRAIAVALTAEIKASDPTIKKRLEMVGIKSINNIVDISNYLMIGLGQPTHIFDYEKIGKGIMKMRTSRRGEKIITLDEKEIILPGGDIVIEDGNGDLIDLCGIMGGLNSAVSETTKKIVFFAMTYDRHIIRKTSLLTGQRTMASSYFEKGLDEERVDRAFDQGITLLEKYAGASIVSPLQHFYPHPASPSKIHTTYSYITNAIGVKIKHTIITSILHSLGFEVEEKTDSDTAYTIIVPFYRGNDVYAKEDIVEEIARVWGYDHIPAHIPSFARAPSFEKTYLGIEKIKQFLKNQGLVEQYNYSMVSEKDLIDLAFDVNKHLKIQNPISQEHTFLRTSLIPSLIRNIQENYEKKNRLYFFEIAHTYHKKSGDLPHEIVRLGIATTTDFFDLKGIIESLCDELHIENIHYKPTQEVSYLHTGIQATVTHVNTPLGFCGKLSYVTALQKNIEKPVILAEIELPLLLTLARRFGHFSPITPFALIKRDISMKKDQTYEEILQKLHSLLLPAKKQSVIYDIALLTTYRDRITFRLSFWSTQKNITEKEV